MSDVLLNLRSSKITSRAECSRDFTDFNVPKLLPWKVTVVEWIVFIPSNSTKLTLLSRQPMQLLDNSSLGMFQLEQFCCTPLQKSWINFYASLTRWIPKYWISLSVMFSSLWRSAEPLLTTSAMDSSSNAFSTRSSSHSCSILMNSSTKLSFPSVLSVATSQPSW